MVKFVATRTTINSKGETNTRQIISSLCLWKVEADVFAEIGLALVDQGFTLLAQSTYCEPYELKDGQEYRTMLLVHEDGTQLRFAISGKVE